MKAETLQEMLVNLKIHSTMNMLYMNWIHLRNYNEDAEQTTTQKIKDKACR
jgi:hypothetical protein